MARNRRNKRKLGPRIFDYIEGKTFFIALSIMLGILVIALFLINFHSSSQMDKLTKQVEELNYRVQPIYEAKDTPEQEEEQDPEDQVNLHILSDIFCNTALISDSYDKESYQYDFRKILANVKNVTKESDLTIATVETNFTKEDYTSGDKFNSPTEFADALMDAGLGVVNVATEHMQDYSQDGFYESKDYWNRKNMVVVGDNTEETRVKIKSVKDMKIAFVSYIQANLVPTPQMQTPIYNKETAKKDMEYAKQNADFVIVFMHWSGLNQSFASTNEISLAEELVGLGADMILGNHSNYVHQMEVKQNAAGKNVLVVYSLGNMFLQTNDSHTQAELLLKVALRRSEKDGKVYLQKVDYIPYYLLDNGDRAQTRFEYFDLRQRLESYQTVPTDEDGKARYEQMKDTLKWIEDVVVGG